MKHYLLLLSVGFLLFGTACKKDTPIDNQFDETLTMLLEQASNNQGLSHFAMPDSDDLSTIPQDPKNPLTAEKVALGKLLYHETALAIHPINSIAKGTYSCASCHFAAGGFAACKPQGIADGGLGFGESGESRDMMPHYLEAEIDIQPIKTPSAMNGAFQSVTLWNGSLGGVDINVGTESNWETGTPKENNHLGLHGLETQAIAGLTVHRMGIDMELIETTEYQALFDAAFPDIDESERYTIHTTGLAIAAYERTILANEAPFQQWLKGNQQAMTEEEKEGAIVFFGDGQCAKCHTGPALNSMTFYAYGMKDLYENPDIFQADPFADANLGRGGFTGRAADMFKFKTPQLYNLDDSPHYGHGSSFYNLKDVVEYKNKALPENQNVTPGLLANEFKPLILTEKQVNDLTAFLKTGLKDPNLMRYQPTSIPSGNCFPNNDNLSKIELGCE